MSTTTEQRAAGAFPKAAVRDPVGSVVELPPGTDEAGRPRIDLQDASETVRAEGSAPEAVPAQGSGAAGAFPEAQVFHLSPGDHLLNCKAAQEQAVSSIMGGRILKPEERAAIQAQMASMSTSTLAGNGQGSGQGTATPPIPTAAGMSSPTFQGATQPVFQGAQQQIGGNMAPPAT